MHVFHQPYQLVNIVGYQLCQYVASPLLICLLQGQANLVGKEPKYIDAKSPAELNENEAAMTTIILYPPKNKYRD